VQQVKGVERSPPLRGGFQASIEVEFNRGTDMDFARLDLSERMATVEEELPLGVGRVRVQPYVPREFEGR
jgi:Cu/Ag efflux pump CusA